MAGLSLRTFQRLIAVPPVVSTVRGMGRDKAMLLRLGEPAAVNHRKLANTLSKLWREHRGEAMTSHRDYGLLFGLVETWPEGWQVRIFEHTLRCWSAFCAMTKLEIHTATAFAGHDPFAPDLLSDPLFETARRCHGVPLDAGRRFRHVSLSFLRRFAHVAQELFLMDREERGLRVPPALRATSGGIYHHCG